MKIAVISDIHDNVWNLGKAMDAIMGNADTLICCGDLCSPFIVSLMAGGFIDLPVHIVFGNNDADLYRITRTANYNINLYGELAELVEVDGQLISLSEIKQNGKNPPKETVGKQIAVNHYPALAYGLAATGNYDVVCFGHNHKFQVERLKDCLLINPGPLMGYDPEIRRDVPPSYVIYDTESNTAAGYRVLLPYETEDGQRRIEPFP